MVLFDYEKTSNLMQEQNIDLLLPHTILNASYISDHIKQTNLASIGAYFTTDEGLPYYYFVVVPP